MKNSGGACRSWARDRTAWDVPTQELLNDLFGRLADPEQMLRAFGLDTAIAATQESQEGRAA